MKKWFFVVTSIVILIILVAIFFYIREYKNTKNKNTNNYNFIKSNENTITNNNTIINNGNNIPNNNDVQGLKERSIKNVKMEIKEGTLNKDGASIIIKDTNLYPFSYGYWFKIEKKVNNNWQEPKIINHEYTFPALGFNINNTGKFETNVKWIDLYGALDKGTYRLIKKVYDNEGSEIYFSVEFNITE